MNHSNPTHAIEDYAAQMLQYQPRTDHDDPFRRLLWLDFETTGLYDFGDQVHLLEVAAVVTDKDLNIISEPLSMVLGAEPHVLESLNSYVRKMHTANGLLDEVATSQRTLEEADAALAELISAYFPPKDQAPETTYEYKGAVVAGSSVGSFDLRVLTENFPDSRKLCSHRTYDISAVNEFTARLNLPPVNTAASSASSTHRAVDDVMASIGRAAALREQFLEVL
ncbi:oligoribonuclease [Nesterenkonia rhizosphaerae]|uniref:Oligoribonuclease n=1 Tax=Nesterenkonia rhizosphaerae TaxID=1348272 RepID=A0ABP9G2Y3_9MICC